MNDEEFDEPSENNLFGHSGTPSDTLRVFTIEEAARALVYDKTGRYVPPLANALDPLGALYIEWRNRLMEAFDDDDERYRLQRSQFENDKRFFIQRDDLRDWCLRHGMKPKFLYPKDAPDSFERTALEVAGYEPTKELLVMIEAIKKFWANADRAKPPKKDEEIIPWILERVDSDVKAKAIDSLIRPEWARKGGNKKQAKG